jgi:hypothetical protein
VEDDPGTLDRRMSRFERGQTPLHYAISLERYDILDLLIDLGADLEAEDGVGHTALATAVFRGDREAVDHLRAAGAKEPPAIDETSFGPRMAALAGSITEQNVMLNVPDVEETLAWYVSIGFVETGRNVDDGLVNWGAVSYGKSRLMFNVGGKRGDQSVSLWFGSDRIEELYALHRARQLKLAQAALAGEAVNSLEVHSLQELNSPFYGGRQFGFRDLNGFLLFFDEKGAT